MIIQKYMSFIKRNNVRLMRYTNREAIAKFIYSYLNIYNTIIV